MTTSYQFVSTRLVFSVLLTFFISAQAISQNSTYDYVVKQININDQIAPNVRIKEGRNALVTRNLKVGEGIRSGTLIQAQPNYTIVFSSSNSNDVIAVSGAKVRLNKGVNGENISVCQGKVMVNVNNITGFYYVRDCEGNITLASRSTKYSVDVRSNGIYYETTEGQTQVHQKQRLQLNSNQNNQNQRQNRILTGVSINAQNENSGAGFIDPDNLPMNNEFDSLEDAIADYERLLLNVRGDSDLALDLNISLASLYLDLEEYDKAIDKLQAAINLLNEIDPYDSEMGELYLDLAEAQKYGGYEYNSVLDTAIIILEDDISFNKEELSYAIADGDTEFQEFLEEEIKYLQEDLDWAYSLR